MRANGGTGRGTGSLTIDLFAPGMTAVHRVGLAGLAMTLEALATDDAAAELRALGSWQVDERKVTLEWTGDGRAFFKALLERSFRVTEGGLIWFPALGHPLETLGQAAVLHNAVLNTFLQHPRSRGSAAKKQVSLAVEVDEDNYIMTFLPLEWYAHQRAEFDGSKPLKVAGWLYPGGVVRHVQAGSETALSEDAPRALALLYAPVGAIYFEAHRRAGGVRPRYCLVLPDVRNLLGYADARRLFLRQGIARLQVAGAAEAAARVLTELEVRGLLQEVSTPACAVMGFGTVPWSKRQKTRVELFRVGGDRRVGVEAYRVATSVLRPRIVVGKPDPKTGAIKRWWHVPQVPDLVAENVIGGAPWWLGFAGLWDRVRQGTGAKGREWALHNEREGLQQMVNEPRTMPDGAEARLVRACHEAWRRRLGALGERAREQGLDFKVMFRRERERVRISFARCKNEAMLRQALTDFWSRAGALPDLQDGWSEILPLLKDRWGEARDLALLALASYKPQSKEEEDALGDQAVAEGELEEGETIA